jgi:hypothetical protein
MKSIPHKLVFLMNMLGMLAWLLLGGLLYPLNTSDSPLNLGLSISLVYGAITLVPALSAYVLLKQKHGRTNLFAIGANFCLIVFFSFSFANIASQTGIDSALIITLIVILIPALLNLHTLNKMRGIAN